MVAHPLGLYRPQMAAMNDEMRTYPWQKTYMFGVDVTF